MGKRAYATALTDVRWQRKQLLVLQRSNWRCEWCGDAGKSLEVHHGYYGKTNGKLRATRPIEVNGVLVEGLSLEFKAGEIIRMHADHGEDVFAEYIQSDPGGRRLGEVALVSIDSPVYKSGLVFEEILLDENAACHIAVGSAYKHCLERGDVMSREELDRIGCNESTVHTDIMISDEETDVWALTSGGREILIVKKGKGREL